MNKARKTISGRWAAGNQRIRLLVLVAGLGGGSGCFLSARSPQAPLSQNQIQFDPPTSMDLVLRNVRRTFQAKSVDNYNRSLDATFGFTPDPADQSESGEPSSFWAAWNKQQEVQAFTNILNQNSTVTITFAWPDSSALTPIPSGSPNESYYKDLTYQMVLFKAAKDTTFSGKADLYMVETNGLFTITKWVDKRDGSAHATLGLVRWKGSIQF